MNRTQRTLPRVTLVPGDYNVDPLPGGADLAVNRGDEGNAGHVIGALALQYQTPSSITNSVDLLHH